MLLKNKDASSITIRNQNRMLYANYIIQQKRVDGGCQLRVKLETGNTGDFSIIPKLLQGASETTALEAQTDISANSCPITNIPDPYLTDQIYLTLTTNQAAYKAAAFGSWLAITSTEYTALQTSITGTSLAGTDASTFSGISSSSFTFNNFAATNIDTTFTPKITANTYIYAFAIKINKNPVTTVLNNIRVYANNSKSVYSGYVMIGSSPLPIPVLGANYYVYKGQSAVNASTDSLLAVTAPGDGTLNAQAMHIGWASGLDSSISVRYIDSATLPLSSSTTLSTSPGLGRAFGIQALTTPTKQWVTS